MQPGFPNGVYVIAASWLLMVTSAGDTDPGRITLGCILPAHKFSNPEGDGCAEEIDPAGIQALEALFFALDTINSNATFLPDTSLELDVITDSCDAFSSLVYYFHKELMGFNNVTNRNPMVGIIEGGPSPRTTQLLTYLSDKQHKYQIPQISYASTGIELSDKSRFEYFSRVVPPDTYQAQAMVDVVKAFNWTYVSTLADEGNYGEKGIDTFKTLAEQSGLCIAKSIEIPREIKNHTFVEIIKQLTDKSKARVVVLFVNEDNCRRLVNASHQLGMQNNLYWLASDSWGAKEVPVRNQEQAAEGAVTILPQREVVKEFDEYFMKLNPSNNKRNPWFNEFWEKHFHCSFEASRNNQRCTGYEYLGPPTYQQEGIVPFVIDAVYAMAHALNDMLHTQCPGAKFCSAMDPPDGHKLLQFIRNVTFTGVARQIIKFNTNGDAMGRYTIYQFQKRDNNKYEYVPIGNWSDSLAIDVSLTRWKAQNSELPRSVCSEPCAAGHVMRNDDAVDKCCWVCIPCENHMILKDERTCEPCPNGTYPDQDQTMCYALPVHYMSLDSAWAIVPVIVASIGVVLTLFIAAVFFKFNDTPVIMASGRELCYVLMIGLLLCYFMTFIMVTKPSTVTCCFMRVGLGLSLSICYAALFTKTNRISRIFNRGIKAMVKRPSYTSPKSQLIVCACLISVQVIGAITWVGMDLPSTSLAFPDRKTVVLRCKSTNVAIVLSLLYNMILIILCTVYAFKTRNIPENFNEAKHIAFTMYSTCIVWLAFVPIYFGTNKSDFRIQITALCMCVSISATVALGCMFVPKIYIVLFQPHKNVRQGAKGSSIGSGLGRPLFGRPSTRFSSLAAMNGDITSPSNVPDRSVPIDRDSTIMDEMTCYTQFSQNNEQATVLQDLKSDENLSPVTLSDSPKNTSLQS